MAGLPLHELLRRVGLRAPDLVGEGPSVLGVCHDSRRVEPGDLFVAIVGERFDGRRYADDAAARGAVAVLGPAPEGEAPDLPWIEAADPRRHLGALAAEVYAAAERPLTVGVTGTNGKSSVITLLAAVLEADGRAPGTVGTLGYRFRERSWEGGRRTTPEASDVHRILSEMQAAGAASMVMEVSSHALELGRVDGVRYDLAVFTNLSRDHLDFHGDMESYFLAKRRLFERLGPGGAAVVHIQDGDPWGRRLADELRRAWASLAPAEAPRLLTCGGEGTDVRLSSRRVDLEGLRATLRTPEGEITLRSRLLGRFHLENLVTTATAALALGVPKEIIEHSLAAVGPVPGRLERVPGDVVALVDYAHTPAALEAALVATRELTPKPIIAVFGCGGERDRGKRPEMGRIAGERADLPILTSDNPRREDPLRILADAEEGLRRSGCALYLVEPDRRTAIHQAVQRARAGDFVVLVAGKGHEASQDLGDRVIELDDRVELQAAMAAGAFLDGAAKNADLEEIHCG